MTLKVIHRLQTFSNAIRRTFVQHFTRFQLTVCWHGSSAVAELLVVFVAPSQYFGRRARRPPGTPAWSQRGRGIAQFPQNTPLIEYSRYNRLSRAAR